jgi:hypothetical protein
MSERETVVELPWDADSCTCLRTVLPLTVAFRDGAVGAAGRVVCVSRPSVAWAYRGSRKEGDTYLVQCNPHLVLRQPLDQAQELAHGAQHLRTSHGGCDDLRHDNVALVGYIAAYRISVRRHA